MAVCGVARRGTDPAKVDALIRRLGEPTVPADERWWASQGVWWDDPSVSDMPDVPVRLEDVRAELQGRVARLERGVQGRDVSGLSPEEQAAFRLQERTDHAKRLAKAREQVRRVDELYSAPLTEADVARIDRLWRARLRANVMQVFSEVEAAPNFAKQGIWRSARTQRLDPTYLRNQAELRVRAERVERDTIESTDVQTSWRDPVDIRRERAERQKKARGAAPRLKPEKGSMEETIQQAESSRIKGQRETYEGRGKDRRVVKEQVLPQRFDPETGRLRDNWVPRQTAEIDPITGRPRQSADVEESAYVQGRREQQADEASRARPASSLSSAEEARQIFRQEYGRDPVVDYSPDTKAVLNDLWRERVARMSDAQKARTTQEQMMSLVIGDYKVATGKYPQKYMVPQDRMLMDVFEREVIDRGGRAENTPFTGYEGRAQDEVAAVADTTQVSAGGRDYTVQGDQDITTGQTVNRRVNPDEQLPERLAEPLDDITVDEMYDRWVEEVGIDTADTVPEAVVRSYVEQYGQTPTMQQLRLFQNKRAQAAKRSGDA